ncbi:MAG: glycogen debranching protein, partial [Deltaproteobacteria bacterium]
KAVEINALFYNALRLFDAWTGDRLARAAAERLRASFNARFVLQDRLYDVLDPDDAALRPNQLFAISLPHPVLDRSRWEPVLRTLRDELLTPFGLRTLGPREPGYQPRYEGDLRSRDRAYHQGTVWPWLIGPFIDAWTKVFPQHDPRPLLAPLEAYLRENGSVSEIFDAEPPHAPRGCVAQAWSVAEVLRLRR